MRIVIIWAPHVHVLSQNYALYHERNPQIFKLNTILHVLDGSDACTRGACKQKGVIMAQHLSRALTADPHWCVSACDYGILLYTCTAQGYIDAGWSIYARSSMAQYRESIHSYRISTIFKLRKHQVTRSLLNHLCSKLFVMMQAEIAYARPVMVQYRNCTPDSNSTTGCVCTDAGWNNICQAHHRALQRLYSWQQQHSRVCLHQCRLK